MTEEFTEIADSSSWKLKNSSLTAMKPPGVQTRPSLCGREW